MKKYVVTLSKDEWKILGELTSKRSQKSLKILNALILLGCNDGKWKRSRIRMDPQKK